MKVEKLYIGNVIDIALKQADEIRIGEIIHKIQKSTWITFLLFSVATARALNQVWPALKPRHLRILWPTRSNRADMRFVLAPHLVSHLQLIIKPWRCARDSC